jgi:hypothetical protein
MKVIAIKLGYYGNKRRREGESFFIKSEKDFSPNWMKKVDDSTDAPSKKAGKKVYPVSSNDEVI